MSLGDIHSEVKGLLARGSSLDGAIPGYVRRAARWLEENYNFLHMQRLGTVDVAAGQQTVDAPNSRVKLIKAIRRVDADARSNLRQVDLEEVNSYAAGKPEGYVLLSPTKLMLDCKTGAAYTFEMFWLEYTAWSADLAFETWLTEDAENLLICQTLVMIGQRTRDEAMIAANKVLRDEAVKVILDSQAEAVQANRDFIMKVNTR